MILKSKLCAKSCAFDWQLIVERAAALKTWTFSQDVASLPSLRGSREESSAFNFLFVLRLLRPHSPSLACDLCYSSCAVCAARSWKGRKTDLENYFTCVISARLGTLTAASRLKPTGAEAGWSDAVPWGATTASFCAPVLLPRSGLCSVFPVVEQEEAPPAWPKCPETSATITSFLLSLQPGTHTCTHTCTHGTEPERLLKATKTLCRFDCGVKGLLQ